MSNTYKKVQLTDPEDNTLFWIPLTYSSAVYDASGRTLEDIVRDMATIETLASSFTLGNQINSSSGNTLGWVTLTNLNGVTQRIRVPFSALVDDESGTPNNVTSIIDGNF